MRTDTPAPDPLTADWLDVLAATQLDVRRWARTRSDLLGGCRSADDVLRRIRVTPDPVLGFLLAEHLTGHPHAGRIVWHSMLPKMRVMQRRDPRATFEDYTGHLWLRLCTYPLAARPYRIAANLALDTLKQVKAEQVSRELALGPERLDARPGDALDELSTRRVLRAARDLGLIDAATHRVLTTVYAGELNGAEAAEALGMSRDAVRARCSRAVRRLRDHAVELAEA